MRRSVALVRRGGLVSTLACVKTDMSTDADPGRPTAGLSLGPRCLLAAITALASVGPLADVGLAAPPSACTQSGQTVTCTYSSGSNPLTVPADVSSISVVAVGAAGEGGGLDDDGGPGALVRGALRVTPGTTIYAVVGAPGGGGAGGGGALSAGAGGGASDVRTLPDLLSSRLIVAAGGGGGGGVGGEALEEAHFFSGASGRGGAGGSGGGDSSGGGSGGLEATGHAGGEGGAAGSSGCIYTPPPDSPICAAGNAGSAGALGAGGSGGGGGVFSSSPLFAVGGGGGGGGAGWFGGGGGGGGGLVAGGGGGGGGSNLVPVGGSHAIDATGMPMVQISYALAPTTSARCSRNGWRDYGARFKDQGQCEAFVMRWARQRCLAQRSRIGMSTFGERYGVGRSHVHALRRCINLTAAGG